MSKLQNFPLQLHKAKFWMTLLWDNESSQVMEFGFRLIKVAIMKLSKSISTSDLLWIWVLEDEECVGDSDIIIHT